MRVLGPRRELRWYEIGAFLLALVLASNLLSADDQTWGAVLLLVIFSAYNLLRGRDRPSLIWLLLAIAAFGVVQYHRFDL